jgi:hypothetical protein
MDLLKGGVCSDEKCETCFGGASGKTMEIS